MKLSVVIPLYNEEECVPPLIDELLPVVAEIDPEAEVILVDDGSADATADRVRDAQATAPTTIRFVQLLENSGQTAALDAGFRVARGDVVATLDGDLQVDPRDLPMMMDLVERYDVVHGWRRTRKDTGFKRVQTKIANAVRNRLLKSDIHDTGCPLKVMRRLVLEELKLQTGFHRFLVNLARLEGFTTCEVEVHHRPRPAGKSKYGFFNRVFAAWRDLRGVRWMAARHYRLEAIEYPPPGTEGPSQIPIGRRGGNTSDPVEGPHPSR